MSLSTSLIRLLFSGRLRTIDTFEKQGVAIQRNLLGRLIDQARDTAFGRAHHFDGINSPEDFARAVPIVDYDSFSPWIERTRRGERDVIWPGAVQWYAKSSGTTASKSKFIPVTREGLLGCHLQGPRDVLALFAHQYPKSRVFEGKTLTLGGSHRLEEMGGVAQAGDISAILIENTPSWAKTRRIPSVDTALIADFDQKVEAICKEAIPQRVTNFAGVPSWNLVLMHRILEHTGKANIMEVWPHMELFVHGGMKFAPYRAQYEACFPSSEMKYMETYNASEGFFGIQDSPERDDMLLMLDYGVYYEFLPTRTLHDPSTAVPLEGVELGVNYALIITTSNGLWRYQIGDTVEFTSLAPHRIRITGRTKHFINAFGEELIIDNAEQALAAACAETGAQLREYTAGPIYMGEAGSATQGSHEWLIEFDTPPSDMGRFSELLDTTLQQLNSDYEAKRTGNCTLLPPQVREVPQGSFYRWMERRGKVGGQNKVPRLSNDRTFLDPLITSLNDPADGC